MTSDEMIAAIERAFHGIARPATSMRQFHLTDEFGMSREITDKEWAAAGKSRVDFEWTAIPDAEIEECSCLLAHMDAAEFQYYLPAYMRFVVRHVHASVLKRANEVLCFTVSALSPGNKSDAFHAFSVSKYVLFGSSQIRVIKEFLAFIALMDDNNCQEDALRALERFWAGRC